MTTSSDVAQWDIWLTYFYFIDNPSIGKVRPALVVEVTQDMVAVAKITSAAPIPDTGDYAIQTGHKQGSESPRQSGVRRLS